jgi:hypothetical protein
MSLKKKNLQRTYTVPTIAIDERDAMTKTFFNHSIMEYAWIEGVSSVNIEIDTRQNWRNPAWLSEEIRQALRSKMKCT